MGLVVTFRVSDHIQLIKLTHMHMYIHTWVQLCWGLFLFLTATRITGQVFSEPISKWLTGCFLLLQREGRRRRGPTGKEKERCWKVCVCVCVWERERSDHLLQWREFVNCTSNRRAVSHRMGQWEEEKWGHLWHHRWHGMRVACMRELSNE